MARLFDGVNDSLQATVVLSASNKLTLAFWLYWDAFANDDLLAMELTANFNTTAGTFIVDPNSSDTPPANSFEFALHGDVGFCRALFSRPSAAAWHHYVCTMDMSASSHEIAAIYMDGTSQSITYFTDDNNTGNFTGSTTLNFMSRNNASLWGKGRLAEVGIWVGVNLDAGEAKALAQGLTPPGVRPGSLEYYWPLIGRTSPEIELMGGASATVNGATTTDHPRVIQPSKAYIKADAHHVVAAEFSPVWAVDWVNPVGIAKPADISGRQYTTFAMPPISFLATSEPLPWLGKSTTVIVKAPAWSTAHITKESVGAPLFLPAIGWFPSGGQQPQRASAYPPPPPLAWPNPATMDHPPFPFVQPWFAPLPRPHYDFKLVSSLVSKAPISPTPATPPPVVTPDCGLTLGDLKERLYQETDDIGTYYTQNEARYALNAALNTFALLTLCVEREANFVVSQTSPSAFYMISDQIADFLVPLRATLAGTRVRPTTIHQLAARYGAWQSTIGVPTEYVVMGYDFLAVHPVSAAPDVLRLTYAATPVQLVDDTDMPEIPTEQHVHLVDYAVWWLRLKEGGQELANAAADNLKRFINAADKYGQFVRRRSYGQRYDTVPFDLSSFDRGRLEIMLTQQPTRRRQ